MSSPFVSKYGVSHPLDLRIRRKKKQFIWWIFFFFFNEAACIPDLTLDTLFGDRFLKDIVGCLIRGHTPQQALCVHFLT